MKVDGMRERDGKGLRMGEWAWVWLSYVFSYESTSNSANEDQYHTNHHAMAMQAVEAVVCMEDMLICYCLLFVPVFFRCWGPKATSKKPSCSLRATRFAW